MEESKRITMKKIAQRAKVSLATVSRVVSGSSSIRPSLRKAVEEAVRDLGYTSTKPRERTRVKKIAVMVPDITNPFFPLLLKGIANIARVQNVQIALYDSSTDETIEKNNINMLLNNGINGLIMIPFSEHISPMILKLIEEKFPLVFLDREIDREDISSVTSDNEEGAFQATKYLLDLGHKDILFISGPPHLSTSRLRARGYERALADHKIDYKGELVVVGDTSFESAYYEVNKAIDDKIRFTAVFASNDLMALGARRAIENHGFRVPDDFSLIGYDDIGFSSYFSLTTIAQPSYEMGKNSLMLLLDIMAQKRISPQRIVLRDSFIIRNSCRKI
jgi:LacI family transcriptional regulator